MPQIKVSLKDFQPDLYFAPYFWRGLPIGKLPVAVMIHDLAFPVIKKYSSASWYLDWVRKIQYHNALRKAGKADAIITNSENTKQDLKKYVRVDDHKVRSIYLGLSDNVKKVTPKKSVLLKYLPGDVLSNGYILYYGGLEANKNVSTLVRSYARLLKEIEHNSAMENSPYLVLGGADFTRLDLQNPLLAEIRYLIDDLALTDRVFFTGFFEEEDLPHLICASKLFVHLSLYEGFGFAPLEPMKCGIPVVASNRSCYPEILGDGAYLVDPLDESAVAKACLEVLTDKALYKRLSSAGMKRASSFTWDKTARETYEFFSQTIKK